MPVTKVSRRLWTEAVVQTTTTVKVRSTHLLVTAKQVFDSRGGLHIWAKNGPP